GGEGGGGQLADDAAYVILQCQYLRPLADRLAGVGPDRRVQVLSQAGARGDRSVAGSLQRVCVSNRNECEGMAQRVRPEGNPHRVRGPDRGIQQDERGHRARSGVDGAAAQADGVVRSHLAGLPIYKMTGSGNDFVMVDGRHTAPAQGRVLETDAGSYERRNATPGERAELRLAAVPAPSPVSGLVADDGEQRVALGIVGVPHLVVLVDDVSCVDLALRGRALRSD